MKKLLITLHVVFFISLSFGQSVVTIVGTPEVAGVTDQPTNSLLAKLNKPYDMAFDSKGNMWITESGNHTLTMVRASDNKVMIRAGMAGSAGFKNGDGTQTQFNSPMGIVVGSNDEIYVCDNGNHVIKKISPYVDESTPQTVSVFAGKYDEGTSSCTAYPGFADGSSSIAQFKEPMDIALDANGNLIVADYENHIIRKITSTGIVSTLAGQPGISGNTNGDAVSVAKFKNPSGIFLNGSEIMVTEYGNSALRIISGGVVSKKPFWGLNYPGHLIYSYSNGTSNYYVTTGNTIKRSWESTSSTGTEVYAGNAYNGGFADGSIENALFRNVKGICYGPGNSIYVADMDNHVIRKIMYCPVIIPALTIIGDEKFCKGDSVIYKAPLGYSSYLWSTGEDGLQIVVKESDFISLKVVDSNGCIGNSGLKAPTMLTPELVIFGDTILCEGEQVQIEPMYDFDSYAWNTGEKTHVIYAKESGIYKVVLTHKNCVLTSREVTVIVNEIPDKPELTVTNNMIISSDAFAYQWFKNGKAITGATSKSMSVSNSGNFKVKITNENGCENFSDEVYVIGSSIQEEHRLTLKLYPNPTEDFINIDPGSFSEKEIEVELINQMGQLVLRQHAEEGEIVRIDVRNLNKGVYIISVRSVTNSYTGRFLLK